MKTSAQENRSLEKEVSKQHFREVELQVSFLLPPPPSKFLVWIQKVEGARTKDGKFLIASGGAQFFAVKGSAWEIGRKSEHFGKKA